MSANPPLLLDFHFDDDTNQLSITYDRSMNVTAAVGATNLRYFDGSDEWRWSATLINGDPTLTFLMVHFGASANPTSVLYAQSPSVISDDAGTAWPAGTYTL